MTRGAKRLAFMDKIITLELLASHEQDGGSRNKQTPNVMSAKEDRSATYRGHSELGFM
jgi:hypothetical protein